MAGGKPQITEFETLNPLWSRKWGLPQARLIRCAAFESLDYGLGAGISSVNDGSNFDIEGVDSFDFVERRLHSLHALRSIHANDGQDGRFGIGIKCFVLAGRVGGLISIIAIAAREGDAANQAE
jgi:hypothetical protein